MIKAEAKGRKKSVIMGPAETMTREEFEQLERRERVGLIKRLIPLGLMAVAEELQREVDEIITESVDPQTQRASARKYGSNPGSVILGNQRVPIRVPRLRNRDGAEIPLTSYDALHSEDDRVTLYNSIVNGVSCRSYEKTVTAHSGTIAKSKSTVSRHFIEASTAHLKALSARDLSKESFVALFIDGKAFADAQMVIALGVTMTGTKTFLGFVQTATENSRSIGLFLESLLARGLDLSQGILAVTDGAKGLISALKQSFSKRVVIQRCQWHKRENVVSYLAKADQEAMRKTLQNAYDRPILEEARSALNAILGGLSRVNQNAARSLEEGLPETLTLHRLGLYAKLGRSFKTTNCLESVNSTAEQICGKVDYWKNPGQRERWLASALIEIEPTLNRVAGYEHLPELRSSIAKDLGL